MVIKLGSKVHAAPKEHQGIFRPPSRQRPDTTGAGDSLCAGSHGIAIGKSIEEACVIGNAVVPLRAVGGRHNGYKPTPIERFIRINT